jgi:signal peptidase
MLRTALKVLNVVVTVGLVLLILASAALAISARRAKDALPSVAGRKVLTVLSGSMEPTIRTGDVIIVRPMAMGELAKEGDVITFRAKEEKNILITHRVVGLIRANEKPVAYVTKGDNNETEDLTPVPIDQVIGTYEWRVPFFGYIANFMRKPFGILLFVIVPGLLFVGGELKRIWHALEEAEDSVQDPKSQGKGGPAGHV